MRVLVSAIVLSGLLAVGVHTPSAYAGTCNAPARVEECGSACTSWSDCLKCCIVAKGHPSVCRLQCADFLKQARPIRPTRAPRPTRPGPIRATPTATPGPVDPSGMSATCRASLSGQYVSVTLTVVNGTGALLRNVAPDGLLTQVEPGTIFSIDRVSVPRSVPTLAAGASAVFSWRGQLVSGGGVGIIASASAMELTKGLLRTPQVDCGTIGTNVPPPTVPATATKTSTPGPAPTATPGDNSDSALSFITARWQRSAHAHTNGPDQGNTFCARCHSPFQAVASATEGSNQPVNAASWQNVTCASCHPSAALSAAWGTPIATYNIATRGYSPVPLGDSDVLCKNCHQGRYTQTFTDYGKIMHEAAVRCMDCHMARIPGPNPAVGTPPNHDFKVADNLPYSCGTFPGGCHQRRPESWARRVLELYPIHGTGY